MALGLASQASGQDKYLAGRPKVSVPEDDASVAELETYKNHPDVGDLIFDIEVPTQFAETCISGYGEKNIKGLEKLNVTGNGFSEMYEVKTWRLSEDWYIGVWFPDGKGQGVAFPKDAGIKLLVGIRPTAKDGESTTFRFVKVSASTTTVEFPAPAAQKNALRAALSKTILDKLKAGKQLASRPFDTELQPSSHPRIVPLAAGNTLFLCWQDQGAFKIHIHKFNGTQLSQVGQGVQSLGMLGGFTRDASGNFYVLTNNVESPANTGTRQALVQYNVEFPIAASRQNRVIRMVKLNESGGLVRQQDLNSETYTDRPFNGVQNAGTGRLVPGTSGPVALCTRRWYTSHDNTFHQTGAYFELTTDLKVPTYKEDPHVPTSKDVPKKASDTVSHSFEQRAIADGGACVFLHDADMYPSPGLLIQKYYWDTDKRPKLATRCVYTCPTQGNMTHIELGDVRVGKSGYVVLFASSRHKKLPTTLPANLAMVHVVRGFENVKQADLTKIGPDLVNSNGTPDDFSYTHYAYNSATGKWDLPRTKRLSRNVVWLTRYTNANARRPKLAKLGNGNFVAIWEKWGKTGVYDSTWALAIDEMGKIQARPRMIGHMRLNPGDDAFAWNGKVAWATGDAVEKKFVLHTVDQNLNYARQDLAIP